MFFVYDRRTCRTGRVLRRTLGMSGGFPSRLARSGETDFLIRWGYSGGSDAEVTLNSNRAIRNAANKLLSLQLMSDAGVPVVPFSHTPDNLGEVVLGRRNFGSCGQDIVVYKGETAYGTHHDFFTEFIPSEGEIRVHVFDGQVIRSQYKKGEDGDTPIRSHSNGYRLVPFIRRRPNQARLDAATRAIESLGLVYGAVDILLGRDGGTYVLEVNTAPGCDSVTGRAYAEAFLRYAESRERTLTPRWDVLRELSPNED